MQCGLTTLGVLDGTSGHMGRMVLNSSHCFVPGAPGEPGGVDNADITFTAANGDVLAGTYTAEIGSASEIGETFVAELTVTFEGGTGRFSDATGWATVTIVITFEGFTDFFWATEGSWQGEISY